MGKFVIATSAVLCVLLLSGLSTAQAQNCRNGRCALAPQVSVAVSAAPCCCQCDPCECDQCRCGYRQRAITVERSGCCRHVTRTQTIHRHRWFGRCCR